ncbi:hypothetical protein BH23ACT2_BH23ACT2_03060 [soil metagenome]
MRRIVPVVLLWSLVTAAAITAPSMAGAQEEAPDDVDPAEAELPEGFTDGEPVGGTEEPPADMPVAPEQDEDEGGGVGTFSVNTRYFGQDPWNAIRWVSAGTPRCAGLSGDTLAALVVAPIFKESSAATSPSSAPSPMTLSRYDEWSGTNTNTNANANHGLYAFRQPDTSYFRAYWHPGIGIWQYDSAGVGAPFTAIERMDVATVAGDVAKGMASRYCNPPTSIVGHSRPPSIQERRNAAWWPWWTGNPNRECPLCQSEYGYMTSGTMFSNVSLVSGISNTGGSVKRQCTLGGGTHDCWYVDPSVGVIEGATAWARVAPDGNLSPTRQPAPLSRPFYVLKRNGHEERHWLRADTGYNIDISARRQLNRNARPRSNQSGSGLAWANSSGLCDETTGRGSCAAPPPPPPAPAPAPEPRSTIPAPSGINSAATNVSGTYKPITLDHNGNGRADVLWYGPGSAPDSLWVGQGSGRFSHNRAINVQHHWDDVIALDLNGNKREDVLFYNRSTGQAALWLWNADGTFSSQRFNPGPRRQPIVGDFTGDGRDNVLWYGAGMPGSYWGWANGAVTITPRTVNGLYIPLVGDFDGNGVDDIFWYGPGSAPDSLWLHQRGGGFRVVKRPVSGDYRPFVGDFDGNGRDDIVWYSPGGPNSVWFDFTGSRLVTQRFTINSNYTPVVADLQGDGRDDIIWYNPVGSGHLWTRWSAGQARNSVGLNLPGGLDPVVGPFSAGGADGVFWYGPGSVVDAVWYR